MEVFIMFLFFFSFFHFAATIHIIVAMYESKKYKRYLYEDYDYDKRFGTKETRIFYILFASFVFIYRWLKDLVNVFKTIFKD